MSGGTCRGTGRRGVHLSYERPADAVERLCRGFGLQETDLGKDGRSALVAAGAGKIRSGDAVVFLKPVAVARAVVRRDGRVQAGGHPADHARMAWPRTGWMPWPASRM